MANEKQIIIIGGGYSIKPEIEKGLWNKLKGKYTIGLNYSYHYFDSSVQMYVDHKFYTDESERLKSLPLIIGKLHSNLKNKIHPNTIMLNSCHAYDRTIKRGVYKASLVGIFALTLSIYFIKKGEIYLLGYDFGGYKAEKDEKGRKITHFYQKEINHRGIGKIDYYGSHNRGHTDFGCFRELEDIKIYNVGLESYLGEFPKISYQEFYNKLNPELLNQDTIRQDIINQLKKDRYI